MANSATSSAMQLNPVLYRPKSNFDYLRVAAICIIAYASYSIFSLSYQQSVFGKEIQMMALQDQVAELQLKHLKQHPKMKVNKAIKATPQTK